jgi:uncharacterized damage-inducible protein DinB
MTEIESYVHCWQFNRTKTLATLSEFEKLPEPMQAIGWQPGPGRAHAAWQFMHIAITEELFATERLLGAAASFPEFLDKFRGGSTPDRDFPTIAIIQEVLSSTREHLIKTVFTLSENDLDQVPAAFAQRGWTIRTALQVLAWHEAHHQGQIHLTLNLLKNKNA